MYFASGANKGGSSQGAGTGHEIKIEERNGLEVWPGVLGETGLEKCLAVEVE